ncbi:MAG: hypothetical protein ACEY3L_12745 [Wolbachia sp.]
MCILKFVLIKLTAPRIDETPAKCKKKKKIVKSTLDCECEIVLDNRGNSVQPVPAPLSTILPAINKVKKGGRNQKLILFIGGNVILGAPIIY